MRLAATQRIPSNIITDVIGVSEGKQRRPFAATMQ
jgi:hypothetical protein